MDHGFIKFGERLEEDKDTGRVHNYKSSSSRQQHCSAYGLGAVLLTPATTTTTTKKKTVLKTALESEADFP